MKVRLHHSRLALFRCHPRAVPPYFPHDPCPVAARLSPHALFRPRFRGLLPAPVIAQEPPPAAAAKPTDDPAYAQRQALTRAMEIIRQNYVDEKGVTYEEAGGERAGGMLRKLVTL